MKRKRLTDKFPRGKKYQEYLISAELVRELYIETSDKTLDFILRVEK